MDMLQLRPTLVKTSLHAAHTFGGCEKPNDLATASRSKVCTLKMSFIWWLL